MINKKHDDAINAIRELFKDQPFLDYERFCSEIDMIRKESIDRIIPPYKADEVEGFEAENNGTFNAQFNQREYQVARDESTL